MKLKTLLSLIIEINNIQLELGVSGFFENRSYQSATLGFDCHAKP
jgi:hypothetical protein